MVAPPDALPDTGLRYTCTTLGVSMSGIRLRGLFLAVAAAAVAQAPAPAPAQTDPIAIIDRVDRLLRGE